MWPFRYHLLVQIRFPFRAEVFVLSKSGSLKGSVLMIRGTFSMLGAPYLIFVLPSFLGGENCQLLPRVRDAVLMGTRAERIVISSDEWKEWRDILEWVLISEGGNDTAPHTDSHGLSTWITVQKGQVGFGWMSRPTPEERRQWISNPDSYTGGRWRYIILPPGWTVFFTFGTIHFVFRIQAEQTLALGGHILQWTSIRKWLEVVADQVRNPQITNENMEETVKVYIYHILDLMSMRVKNGRIEEIGGQDEVKRVLALVKVGEALPLVLYQLTIVRILKRKSQIYLCLQM
jgi:hypothetical protein